MHSIHTRSEALPGNVQMVYDALEKEAASFGDDEEAEFQAMEEDLLQAMLQFMFNTDIHLAFKKFSILHSLAMSSYVEFRLCINKHKMQHLEI